MRSHCRWCMLLFLPLPLLSGCIHIPAPVARTTIDKLLLAKPIEQGETILVFGKNASQPTHFSDFYFTMGCMGDYQGNTVEQFIKYLLVLNPVPGRFAIRSLGELQGEPPVKTFREPLLTDLGISASKAAQERLRYVIYVNEKIDTTVHIPLYICPFGIAACGNTTVLEATIWEVPSGDMIGTIAASAKGEFVGLAYMLHVLFIPQTQSEAMLQLAQEILKKLTGVTPDKTKVPSPWHVR